MLHVVHQAGYTPLFIASQGGSVKMIAVLLDHGAAVDPYPASSVSP
jgi:hypothetical protein